MSALYRVVNRGTRAEMEIAATSQEFKDYFDRLLKMIPVDVVGLYLIGIGFIPKEYEWVLAIWTIICLAGVFIVRVLGTADSKKKS